MQWSPVIKVMQGELTSMVSLPRLQPFLAGKVSSGARLNAFKPLYVLAKQAGIKVGTGKPLAACGDGIKGIPALRVGSAAVHVQLEGLPWTAN